MYKFFTTLFVLIGQCLGIAQAKQTKKDQETYNEHVEEIQADPVAAFMDKFVDDDGVSKSESDEPAPIVPSSQTKVKPRKLKRRFKRKNQQRNSKPRRFR